MKSSSNDDGRLFSTIESASSEAFDRISRPHHNKMPIVDMDLLEGGPITFQSALDAANDFILIIDLHGKMLYANKSLCTRMHFSKRDLVGQDISRFMVKGGPRDFKNVLIDEVMKKKSWNGTEWIIKKDGSRIRCCMSASLVKDRDSRPLAIVGVSRNVFKERLQKKELLKNDRKLKKINKILDTTNKELKRKAEDFYKANETMFELNKSLETKVQDRTKELQLANEEIITLYTIGKKMVSSLDLNQVLNTISTTVSLMMAADGAIVRIMDKQNKYHVLRVASGVIS